LPGYAIGGLSGGESKDEVLLLFKLILLVMFFLLSCF
jgi:hypothetical protein